MKVFFLRHGAAVEAEEWKGSDFDRPLTEDGRRRIAKEAKALRKLDLGLEAIVTSPLVRAKQTAEIVADALKLQTVEDDRLGPDFNTERLAKIMSDHAKAKAIMVVGHEPNMSATIGQIAGGARIDLKKGGVACVEFSDAQAGNGTLLWLVPPKVIA